MGSDDLKYKKWSSSLQQIVRMRITLVNMPKINGHLVCGPLDFCKMQFYTSINGL